MEKRVIDLLKEYGYKMNKSDKTVSFLLNKITKKALNYCHLKTLPEELEETIVDMCTASYIQIKAVNKASKDLADGTGAVTSIKEGNEQVSFDSGSAGLSLMNSYIDSVFNEFKNGLNRFRKLRW